VNVLKYCCDWFKELTGLVGEKGFSVIAYRDGDYRTFYLQARPFESDVVEKYSSINENTGKNKWPELTDEKGIPAPWVSAIGLSLTHCPRCGADLTKIIRKRRKEFDILADKTSQYFDK